MKHSAQEGYSTYISRPSECEGHSGPSLRALYLAPVSVTSLEGVGDILSTRDIQPIYPAPMRALYLPPVSVTCLEGVRDILSVRDIQPVYPSEGSISSAHERDIPWGS